MKESVKNKIVSDFRAWMDHNYPDMPEHRRRGLAAALGGMAAEAALANADGMARSYTEVVREMEVHKRMFREHVDSLQTISKSLLDFLRKEGVVAIERDMRTRRAAIKPKSRVMVGVVEYLNELDGFITRFYRDVYRIEQKNNEDRSQITLF